jgi:uncharacterized protein
MADEKCSCSGKAFHMVFAVIVLFAIVAVIFQMGGRQAVRAPLVVNPTVQVQSPQDLQRNALSVSGTSELSVAPDKAEVLVSIVTDNMTAKVAQDANRVITNAVMSALKSWGANASDIETDSYTLAKLEEYDSEKAKYIDRGYRLTHTVKVSTKRIDEVGGVVDAAVQAGANGVESITFTLSKDKEKQIRQQAMVAAATAAREKARNLADAAGIELGKAINVQESYYLTPYSFNMKANVMAADSAGSSQISPSKVQVTSSVQMTYEIK